MDMEATMATESGRVGIDDDNPVNEMQPTGATIDEDIGEIVSGMPAGGPDNIGREARESADDPAAQAQIDPFGQGMDAYGAGAARSDCPYGGDSDEAARWLEGWEHQRNAEGPTA